MSNKVSRVQARDLRERAKRVAQQYDRNTWELAKVLWEGSDWHLEDGAPLWQVWGFDSWAEWVDTDIGVNKKVAERLRRIHDTFVVTFPRFHFLARKLTVSKLSQLSGVVTLANVEHLLKWAQARTLMEIESEAQRLRAQARGDTTAKIDPDKHSFQARVTTNELGFIEKTLQMIRTSGGSTRKGRHVYLMAKLARMQLDSAVVYQDDALPAKKASTTPKAAPPVKVKRVSAAA